MVKNEVPVFGLVLVILGALLLLVNIGLIHIGVENIWPLFLLGLGLFFVLQFFSGGRKNPGLLVPGGILITISVIFLICVTLGWHWMEKLWPLFILAPAVGLLQLYLFGERERGLFIPIGILSVVGLTFLANNLGYHQIWRVFIPLFMIMIGLFLLVKRQK